MRMTSKANSFNYDLAAPAYDRHRQGRGPYFSALVALAAACPRGPVLEVGAGTGNNTAPFAEDTGRRMYALEPSAGMLAQGRAKVPGAAWGRGRIEALPYADAAFSMVYGTYMLHYVPDLAAAFAECRRVLKPGGVAAFVTVSHAFIGSHPMNAYFPSFAAVDCARFPDIPTIQSALAGANFIGGHAQATYSAPRVVDMAYWEKIANRFISTYALLPEDEFQAGLARLRDDIQRHGGQLPVSITREAVVVYGWKPGIA